MPAPTTERRYQQVEAQGKIEAFADDGNGLKLGGVWWNQSRQKPVSLLTYKIGDVVVVAADQTADGQRRFLTRIDPLQPKRGPVPDPYQYVDDWPDDGGTPATGGQQSSERGWHDERIREQAEIDAQERQDTRERVGDRLACLQIAASLWTPRWTKAGTDPDTAVLAGVADQLLDWLYRADGDSAL